MSFATIHADCFEWLTERGESTIHAVCTDPPYGLIEFSSEQIAKMRAKKGGGMAHPADVERFRT